MELGFNTLDDLDVSGKTVLVRVDVNSPIDLVTGEILDDTRIRECSPTLEELARKKAKVVVLAHQGRPGRKDFAPLERHARLFEKILGRHVKYVRDIFGQVAQDAIRSLKEGEIVLLENVRFHPEELEERPAQEQARTNLVLELSKLADAYVNDAFATAHRSQPSLVGFCLTLPSVAGRLMERELRGLAPALQIHPCVYVLGGVKADSIDTAESVLNKGIADFVLTGGLTCLVFLAASGKKLGEPNFELLEERGLEAEIGRTSRLLGAHGDKIKMPLDVVIDVRGQPKTISVEELPTEFVISDIGTKTVEDYSTLIAEAKTVVARGSPGVFERAGFERGTFGVLKAMADSKAFTIIGGGHMVAATKAAGIKDRIGHISTGGGASIRLLAGERLPAVEALIEAKVRSKT